MAKKKKATTKRRRTTRRRARVGAIGGGLPLERIAAFAGGAVASQALNGISKNVSALQKNKKILPILKIGIGTYGLMKGSGMVQDASIGFICDGALHFVREAAPNVFKSLTGEPVSGIGATTLIDLDQINGTEYMYGESHQVGAIEDYSVASV